MSSSHKSLGIDGLVHLNLVRTTHLSPDQRLRIRFQFRMVGELAFGYLPMIASILRSARNGVKTTHLICNANLNFNQLQSYVELLLKNNLLEITVDSRQGKIYKTTLKGSSFLGHYHILEEDYERRVKKALY